jgi:O-antigen ligase
MLRYLLLFFFFLMLAGHELGMNVNLGPGLSFKNVLLYLMVVGIAIESAVVRNRKLDAMSVFIPFALLVAYAILTWVITIVFLDRPEYRPRATLISLKSTLVDYFLTLAVFYYGVLNRKDALWLLKGIIVLVVITNGVTLVDSFNIPNLGIIDSRARDGRFLGFMDAANDYGMLLVLFLPLSIALIQTSTGWTRLLAGVGAALTVTCLVLTASRGAYVGAILGLLLSAWYLRRLISIKLVFRGAVLSAMALALMIPLLFLLGYSELILDRFALLEGNAHTASSGRTTFWLNALRVMAESPLSFVTGFGFEAYESSREFSAAMHNHYLNKLFNFGLIGLALFLMVFGSILTAVKASISDAQSDSRPYLVALVIGLLCLLVTQIFGQYYRSAYLVWACLGVGLRLAMEIRRDHVELTGSERGDQPKLQSSLQPASAR